jgi:hypothetical protein
MFSFSATPRGHPSRAVLLFRPAGSTDELAHSLPVPAAENFDCAEHSVQIPVKCWKPEHAHNSAGLCADGCGPPAASHDLAASEPCPFRNLAPIAAAKDVVLW